MSGFVSVHNAANEIEAQRIVDQLKSAGILSYTRDVGSGEYLKIYAGFSVYGKDICVDEEDAAKAKAVIKDITDSYQEDVPDKIPFYKNKVVLVRIYLVLMLFVWLFATIINLF